VIATVDERTGEESMAAPDPTTDLGVSAAPAAEPVPTPMPTDHGDASLLALLDRLTDLLERSDLSELEVEAGGTGLVLRKPSAIAPPPTAAAGTSATSSTSPAGPGAVAQPTAEAAARPSVKAPLTGIYYTSPAPGSAPYVQVGSEIAVGTVIGLIEAMKLFNEIKSDIPGRVARIVAESGTLVKAKQPLIEVDPL
jgi:acetyl-CoA carboxylase biotin carboxyl carrier protein